MSQREGVVGASGRSETAKTAVCPLRSPLRQDSGTGLASAQRVLRGGVAGLLIMTMLSSCVVLREPGFQPPPNTPPSVENRAEGPSPLNRVLVVREEFVGPGFDAGVVQTTFPLSAIVRDPDLNDELVTRLAVTRQDNAGRREQVLGSPDVPSTGVLDREYNFAVPISNLAAAPSCNLLELLVSRGFRDAPQEFIEEPRGDVGSAAWIVARLDDTGSVDLERCPTVTPMDDMP